MSMKYVSGSTTVERKPNGPILRTGATDASGKLLTNTNVATELPQWMWDNYISASMNSWEYQRYVGSTWADNAQSSHSIQSEFDKGVKAAFSIVNHPDSSSAWVNTAFSQSMKIYGRDSGSNYLTGDTCKPHQYALFQPFWAGMDGAWADLTGSQFDK